MNADTTNAEQATTELTKPLITVIIPVYNGEKFLRDSVDGVLAQTHQNLEIILVDDGSSDSSGALCDSYAQADNRVRVIHQPNGGVSSARNAGIDAASGDYIAFVDSDDTIDANMYEVLLETSQSSGADVAVCGYEWHKGDKQKPVRVPEEGFFTVTQIYDKYLEHFVAWASLMTSIWSKFIRADLLRDAAHPIRFPIDLHRSEDASFIVACLAVAERGIAFVDVCPYHYDLAKNATSLTKTVDYHTLEVPIGELRKNMLSALPQRRQEIEDVFACQLAMISVYASIDAIRLGQPAGDKLRWPTVRTIFRNSKRADEKVIALMIFALPRPLLKLVARLV